MVFMAWSGVAIGLAGLLSAGGSLTLGDRQRCQAVKTDPSGRLAFSSLLTWAGVLAVVFYLVTLRTKPPFAEGSLLGQGFLVGSVLTVLSVLVLERLGRLRGPSGEGLGEPQLFIAAASCALVATNAVFLLWRAAPIIPLMGLALAAAMFGIILRLGLASFGLARRSRDALGEPEQDAGCVESNAGPAAEQFALVAILCALGTVVAVQHFPDHHELWPVTLAFGAVTVVAAMAGEALSAAMGAVRHRVGLAALAGLVLAAGVALLLGSLHRELMRAGSAYLVGLLGFGAAMWLSLNGRSRQFAAAAVEGGLSAMLVIAAYVVAFAIDAGLGAAVALLAGVLFGIVGEGLSAPERPGEELAARDASWPYAPLLGLGLVLLAYRLVVSQLKAGPSLEVSEHYALVGLALGMLVSLLWVAYNLGTVAAAQRRLLAANREDPRRPTVATLAVIIGRLAWLGLGTVLPPLLLLVLWRERTLLGFVIGLGLAQMAVIIWCAMGLSGQAGGGGAGWAALQPGLLAVGSVLVAARFSGIVLPLADLPRLHKVWGAAGAMLIVLVWAAVSIKGTVAQDADAKGDVVQ